MKQIYKAMQSYRAWSGLYYSVIDQRLGFYKGTTENILNGFVNPDLEEMAKICIILKMSLNRILREIGYIKGHLTEETKRMLSISKLARQTDYKQAGELFGVSSQQMTAWLRYQTKLPKYCDIPVDLEYVIQMPNKKRWWQF